MEEIRSRGLESVRAIKGHKRVRRVPIKTPKQWMGLALNDWILQQIDATL
jgi:hypothetical protein